MAIWVMLRFNTHTVTNGRKRIVKACAVAEFPSREELRQNIKSVADVSIQLRDKLDYVDSKIVLESSLVKAARSGVVLECARVVENKIQMLNPIFDITNPQLLGIDEYQYSRTLTRLTKMRCLQAVFRVREMNQMQVWHLRADIDAIAEDNYLIGDENMWQFSDGLPACSVKLVNERALDDAGILETFRNSSLCLDIDASEPKDDCKDSDVEALMRIRDTLMFASEENQQGLSAIASKFLDVRDSKNVLNVRNGRRLPKSCSGIAEAIIRDLDKKLQAEEEAWDKFPDLAAMRKEFRIGNKEALAYDEEFVAAALYLARPWVPSLMQVLDHKPEEQFDAFGQYVAYAKPDVEAFGVQLYFFPTWRGIDFDMMSSDARYQHLPMYVVYKGVVIGGTSTTINFYYMAPVYEVLADRSTGRNMVKTASGSCVNFGDFDTKGLVPGKGFDTLDFIRCKGYATTPKSLAEYVNRESKNKRYLIINFKPLFCVNVKRDDIELSKEYLQVRGSRDDIEDFYLSDEGCYDLQVKWNMLVLRSIADGKPITGCKGLADFLIKVALDNDHRRFYDIVVNTSVGKAKFLVRNRGYHTEDIIDYVGTDKVLKNYIDNIIMHLRFGRLTARLCPDSKKPVIVLDDALLRRMNNDELNNTFAFFCALGFESSF